ncbi:hypothetical protein RR48_04156 [Papilio machaon]|uniref:N-acetyltransferase domain-containing protein n=1 Tax=Papilio machaon TaxID=76193 RepID=A0A0N0PAU2_PAPMA|nr:hypothetical protein RR48_04156 [Papilio machaon]
MTQSEAATEIEKMRALEERIKAPSIWGRLPCGIRFEDLQDTRYDDAVKLLKKHYLPEESFLIKIYISLGAFSRTFSRVKLTHNPLYSKVMKFYNEIEKPIDLFKEMGVRRYLKFYVIALKGRYRHRGIAKEMLKAARELAASANVPAIAGIMTTSRGQVIAESLGFVKYNEIYYIRYLIDDQIAFFDTGLGNYGAALMGYRIPDVEEPVEVQPQRSSRFNIQPITTEDDD